MERHSCFEGEIAQEISNDASSLTKHPFSPRRSCRLMNTRIGRVVQDPLLWVMKTHKMSPHSVTIRFKTIPSDASRPHLNLFTIALAIDSVRDESTLDLEGESDEISPDTIESATALLNSIGQKLWRHLVLCNSSSARDLIVDHSHAPEDGHQTLRRRVNYSVDERSARLSARKRMLIDFDCYERRQ